jgi:hypothetical protein
VSALAAEFMQTQPGMANSNSCFEASTHSAASACVGISPLLSLGKHAPPPELSIAHVGIILSCTASFAARDPYRCGIKKDFVKVRVTQYPTSFFPTHPLPKCLGAWNLPHLPLQRFGEYFASSPASSGTSGNSGPNTTQRGLSSA